MTIDRPHQLKILISDREKQWLEALADSRGVSVSDWIRLMTRDAYEAMKPRRLPPMEEHLLRVIIGAPMTMEQLGDAASAAVLGMPTETTLKTLLAGGYVVKREGKYWPTRKGDDAWGLDRRRLEAALQKNARDKAAKASHGRAGKGSGGAGGGR